MHCPSCQVPISVLSLYCSMCGQLLARQRGEAGHQDSRVVSLFQDRRGSSTDPASRYLVDLFDLRERQYRFVSDEMVHLLGVDRASLLGTEGVRFLVDRIHPDDRERRERLYDRFRATLRSTPSGPQDRRVEEFDFRILDHEGRWRVLHSLCIEAGWDDAGNVREVLRISQDVTERLRSDEEMRANEERYRALVNSLAEGVVMQNANGTIVTCNRRAEEILGLTRDQIEGRTSLDPRWRAVHEDGSPFPGETHPSMQCLRTGNAISNTIMGVHRADGSLVWISINAVPVRHATDSSPWAVVCSFHDVTAVRRMDAQVRQSESRLRAILDSTPDCVKMLDEHSRCIEMNQSGLNMLSVPDAKHVIGLSAANWVADDYQAKFRECVKSTFEGKSTFLEFEAIGFNGNRAWLEQRTVPIYDLENPEKIQYALCVTRDITGRKRTEEQVEQLRNEIAHVSRLGTIGEMASGLAHELNQPLAALELSANAALRLDPINQSQLLRECLQRVSEQSLRAGEIIKRMRSFASRGASHRVAADINQLIREVLVLLEHNIRQHAVRINLSLAGNLPPLTVDSIQIQQVLVNLLRNAIEASEDIHTSDRCVRVGTCLEGSSVKVVIEDNGPGIAPGFFGKLFTAFQSTKPSGLGLGLAICRTLIESHGGQIGVEPRVGSGCSFYFCLPVNCEAECQ